MNDKLIWNPDEQRGAWADYFKQLAAPPSQPASCSKILQLIRSGDFKEDILVFTCADIRLAICNLNRKKTTDIEGLTAEHLIYAPNSCLEVRAQVVNNIFNLAKAPDGSKRGYKMPIPKKGKDPQERGNHRASQLHQLLEKSLST